MAAIVTLDARKLSQSVTIKVRVRGLQAMVLRWWLAAQVLKLAALVGGMSMDVEIVD